jgi:alpha-1,6-mannosyltransferase
LPAATPVALYAGRFCAEKRLDIPLTANLRMPKERRPHIVLAGDGPYRGAYERLAKTRDDLTVLPFVNDRAQLARIYRGADFYLAAGPGETFGLAIAEAMACGLPALCVDRGAAPDRARGSGCHELYQHGSVASCAQAMSRLLDRLSPGLRQTCAQHAALNFSWPATFDALHRLYEEMIQARTTS